MQSRIAEIQNKIAEKEAEIRDRELYGSEETKYSIIMDCNEQIRALEMELAYLRPQNKDAKENTKPAQASSQPTVIHHHHYHFHQPAQKGQQSTVDENAMEELAETTVSQKKS